MTVLDGISEDYTFTLPLVEDSNGEVSILQASGSQDGYLSAADWNTFNNKQPALAGSISGTANQVVVSANSNSVAQNVTLSLPTDVIVGTTGGGSLSVVGPFSTVTISQGKISTGYATLYLDAGSTINCGNCLLTNVSGLVITSLTAGYIQISSRTINCFSGDLIITAQGGDISFGNENLLTTGNLQVGGTTTLGALSGILIGTTGVVSAITDNSGNWNTAYGWGDHAGLYDPTGTAVAAVAAHESTYNHSNYDLAVAHISESGASHSYINQNVTTTGQPTFIAATVRIFTIDNGVAEPVRMGGWGAGSFYVAGMTSNTNLFTRFTTADGNGTDHNIFRIMGVGTTTQDTNTEYLDFGWVAPSHYRLATLQTGTGVVRPLIIYTEGNLNQICLNADGRVGINNAAPAAKLDVVGDARFGNSVTNYTQFAADGTLTQAGAARTKQPNAFIFNYRQITAQGKPTLVNVGAFFGFSLPVYNNDNEELFACRCMEHDWDGTSDPVIYIGGWLDTANTSKKFQLQVSVETADFVNNAVVPATTNDYPIEITTGTWAQYTSFIASVTVDASAIVLAAGQPITIRIRRIVASIDEIAGEVVIEGAFLEYVANKLGKAA